MPTLYGLLGVEADADEQSIVDAYRDRAKADHPDVSDDPHAGERFRRLTAARDVLTDAEERARYDRLGHETYVSRHLDDWPVGGAATANDGGTAGGETVSEAAGRTADETAGPTAESRTTQHADRHDGYATATAYYRPGERIGVEAPGAVDRTVGALRAVAPWLVAHLALLAGAVAVAALLLVSTGDGGLPPAASVFVAVTMVGVTAGASALHLSVTLFR